MGCGGYHDHAGGSWLFCICIGPARMAGLVGVRTCSVASVPLSSSTYPSTSL